MIDLFEYAAAQRNRDERDAAIKQVEQNSMPATEIAYADMVKNLQSMPMGAEVTSDTILPKIDHYGFSDPRAVGPLMLRLRKNKCIQQTGRVRPSLRAGNHAVPKAIYLNLIGC
jgi:predicted acetyltransferase